MSEVRVYNEKTGGEKGSKPCQLFWIDARALEALGDVAGMGAEKYAPHNYRKGVNVSLMVNAAYRHILKFQQGVDVDDESGLPHLAHACFVLLAAYTATLDHPECDDRYEPPKKLAIAHSLDEVLDELQPHAPVAVVDHPVFVQLCEEFIEDAREEREAFQRMIDRATSGTQAKRQP